jgi:hypothetical protein
MDHIIPVIQGGLSTPENLVPACHPCNHSKRGRTLAEWFADIGNAVQTALLHRFDEEPFKPAPKRRMPTFEELLAELLADVKPDACWMWRWKSYATGVHRRVYQELREPLEKGQCLVHHVGEGHGRCVNPDHYLVMTPKEACHFHIRRKEEVIRLGRLF